jgi:hypothetical protein
MPGAKKEESAQAFEMKAIQELSGLGHGEFA